MTSGKRNIIIVAALVLLLSISGLHMMIFKPSAKRYRDAVAQFNAEAGQLQNMKNANMEELKAYMNETRELVTEISQGIAQLELEQPIEFLTLDATEVVLENPPANATQQELDVLKHNKMLEINEERHQVQMKLLLGEIEELRGRLDSKVPQNTFLTRQGWAIDKTLPQPLLNASLWDRIKVIAEQKDVLGFIDKSTQQYQVREAEYLRNLASVGLYVNAIEGLYKYGDSVVSIHKMAHANLILNRIPETQPVIILSEVLERENLYNWLSIDLDFTPVKNLEENEVYFMYEQLKALNFLLDKAGQSGIKVVSSVELRGYGYLRKQPQMGSPDVTTIDPASWTDDQVSDAGISADSTAPGAGPGAGMDAVQAKIAELYAEGKYAEAEELENELYYGEGAGGGVSGLLNRTRSTRTTTGPREKFDESLTERREGEDIGYALPIKMSFQASYTQAMQFMYGVLRERPMAELDRIFITSMSRRNPQFTDVEVTVTFIFVPKLFNTLDKVRNVLAGIEMQENAAGAPTGETMAANDGNGIQ